MSRAAMATAPGGQAVCIVADPALRRLLRRTLHGAGANIEFPKSVEDVHVNGTRPSLLFLDRHARQSLTVAEIRQIVGERGGVIMLGASIADDDIIELLRDRGVNHVIHDVETPDEAELLATSAKLLSGDIFGLEKYLAWGAPIYELSVGSYDDKRAAIEGVSSSAQAAGARRPITARIETVTDELLMNALYDAPTVGPTGARGTQPPMVGQQPAMLRYGCDGRHFAISVTDFYGALRKEAILDNLLRARASGGRPRQDADGAGLGIYFVLSSVTRFIANVSQGDRTEIVCLFDLRQTPRESAACAQSLHIFTV